MPDKTTPPGPENGFYAEIAGLLITSYRALTGQRLVRARGSPAELARHLYEAPFAVVAHDNAPDPLFNYANRQALALFEMRWNEFSGMPSRLSAEAPSRDERERLLELAKSQGYIEDYHGVRVTGRGRRFRIEGATVWNLHDHKGIYRGQAARFDHWRFL